MSETTSELVAKMVAAGEWPEPALLRAIVARGEEAVEPLLDVVRRDLKDWPEVAPLDHALGLLRHLPRSDAVLPVALDVFRRFSDETLEQLPGILLPFGAAAFEPILEVMRDSRIGWYARSVASGIAADVSLGDPERFERYKAELRRQLAELVSRADQVSDEELQWASTLVMDLANAGDAADRPLLLQAVEAELSEMMSEDNVERALRRAPAKQPERDFLKEHEDHFKSHQRDLQRQSAPQPTIIPPAPKPRPAAPRLPTPPSAPVAAPERKIGRNDPCWCGSGKKFKNCHLHKP